MSGWASSNRRAELPADWAQRVALVKDRDGGRCRWILPISGKRCPRPGTDVDHRHGPGRHAVEDLWLLCRHHHDKKTAKESWAGMRKKRPSMARPPEAHPGLKRGTLGSM